MSFVKVSWLLCISIKLVCIRIWQGFRYNINHRTLIANYIFFEASLKRIIFKVFFFKSYQWYITVPNPDYKNMIFINLYLHVYIRICIRLFSKLKYFYTGWIVTTNNIIKRSQKNINIILDFFNNKFEM